MNVLLVSCYRQTMLHYYNLRTRNGIMGRTCTPKWIEYFIGLQNIRGGR